jgi:hypothetical protein
VLVELPLAVLRSFFSSTRWIEAVYRWTSEIVITWRTTRDEADALADEIARRLKEGYAGVTPSGAELMTMTRPPGSTTSNREPRAKSDTSARSLLITEAARAAVRSPSEVRT